MAKKYVEIGWESYRKLLVPENASAVQVWETRQAFFGGAAVLFQALMMTLDAGDEPTAADMERMADIQSELDTFGQKLDQTFFKDVFGRN